MSLWTHIYGTIKVDPAGSTIPQQEYILRTVLDHLPPVTGSERDMTVNVVSNIPYTSSSANEFSEDVALKLRSIRGRRRWLFYSTRDTSLIDINTTFNIVINADLRDRTFSETLREFNNWMCRLSKRLSVWEIMLKIEGECPNRTVCLTDPEPWGNMYEEPSWGSEEDEPAWWEYLMPDYIHGYPLKLYHKYANDPEVNEEMKRRYKFMERIEGARL